MLSLAISLWAKHVRTSIAMKKAACVAAVVLSLSASSVIAQTNDVSVTGIAGRSDTRAARTPTKDASRNISKMVAEGILPPSRALDFINAESSNSYHLGELPASVLRQGDADDTGKRAGKRLRIGVARDLSFKLDALKNASVYSVPDGELRIFTVVSDKAKQVRLFLSEVDIPAGGRLYIYSRENTEQVFGPFTKRGVDETGEFWTPPVTGESATVELFLPEGVELDSPAFTVTKVNHIFRDPETIETGSFFKNESDIETFAAGACNLNVTSAWAQVAKSVGRMQFSSDGGEYLCTGTLLNSVNGDMTPYFLTANHCISTIPEAQSLLVKWFYDSANGSSSQSYGASILRTGYQSDFTLLMIGGVLPNGLFWSGWSPSTVNTNTDFTAIHHPRGDYKRISFGKKIGNYDGADDDGNRSLHTVRWNTSGGTTEGGSSGSGLWIGSPNDARLAGNLLGGVAACDNLTGSDYYGRFDVTYPQIADLLAGGPDDEYENNDTREAARLIEVNSIGSGGGGFTVKSTDEDWYRITVPTDNKLVFNLNAIYTFGDVDIELYRAGESSPFAASRTANSDESVTYVNDTSAPVECFIRVFLANDTRADGSFIAKLLPSSPCQFSVSPNQVQVKGSGASGSVLVRAFTSPGSGIPGSGGTAPPACTWRARSNVNWITVTSSAENTGESTVTYRVATNPTATPRTGTLTLAGQTFTIAQSEAPKRRLFGSRVRSASR